MKREKLIIDYVKNLEKNKKILDIGCTDMPNISLHSNFLHKKICENVNKKVKVLGVDNNKNKIKKMKLQGYNCINANILKKFTKQKFDLIIAGEIIEHISDQNKFILSLKNLLSKNGKILITTPNPNGVMSVLGYWFFKNERGGEGHVLWQSPKTLKLLCLKNKLLVKKVYHCDWDYRFYWMYLGYFFELFKRLKPTLLFEIEHL
jgi:2-polyprenyl-3-methyl-5-hydroxy-6-metoxy-1,4-benzoquinol methylase